MKLTKEELTKEKCLKAYQSRMGTRCYGSCKKYTSKDCVECQKGWDVIYDLINEHFDNPPLKFGEICEDEPIFDKKHCYWRYVMQKDYDNDGFYDSINDEWVDFEENRFYAREVKE